MVKGEKIREREMKRNRKKTIKKKAKESKLKNSENFREK